MSPPKRSRRFTSIGCAEDHRSITGRPFGGVRERFRIGRILGLRWLIFDLTAAAGLNAAVGDARKFHCASRFLALVLGLWALVRQAERCAGAPEHRACPTVSHFRRVVLTADS